MHDSVVLETIPVTQVHSDYKVNSGITKTAKPTFQEGRRTVNLDVAAHPMERVKDAFTAMDMMVNDYVSMHSSLSRKEYTWYQ